MILLKLGILVLGIVAICYAFFGALFAAQTRLPLNSRPMKLYKFTYILGISILFFGGFVIIFL